MLTIEKTVTPSPEQWTIILEGMRNPKNSWDRMDSYTTHIEDAETLETADYAFFMGENDENLAMSLAAGGSVHAKYRRMIPVWVTINAPLYFWKEFDTYKVGTVANSCSTMHKIDAKEFTMDDFSHDHLFTVDQELEDYIEEHKDSPHWRASLPSYVLMRIIETLNYYRERFLSHKKKNGIVDREIAKGYWWQMIQLLPSSYNQKRTIFLSYEVLANIYTWRRNHKLTEWHTFCDWIKTLPYSELITLETSGTRERPKTE